MAFEMRYFVLKPRADSNYDKSAKASQSAMYAYADQIEDTDFSLADNLRRWAGREAVRQARLVDDDLPDLGLGHLGRG